MFRYVALAWDSDDVEQEHIADRLTDRLRRNIEPWQTVFELTGLRVLCTGTTRISQRIHRFDDGQGVALGELFVRTADSLSASPSRRPSAEELSGERIVATRGRWLIDRFWGDYVAVIVERPGCRIRILKDPTGPLPAFISTHERVTVAFSRIADCLTLGVGPFRIDPTHLRARIVGFGAGFVRDALENVQQIRRGECVEIEPGAVPTVRARHFVWTPFTFRGVGDLIEDANEAASAMRATVRSCTHTWAGCHERMLLRLSGGLDSSIICGILLDAPNHPLVTCYTVYSPEGRSDERRWARLAVAHTRFEHVEQPLTPRTYRLELAREMPPLSEPAPLPSFLQRNTFDHDLARERGATAVFTGDGGDSGFCSESASYAATEYVTRHGLRPRLLALAAHVASRTQRTIWTALASALRRTGDEPPYDPEQTSRLVSREVRESSPPTTVFPHHWFAHLDQAPWATILRLGSLLGTPQPYDVISRCANAPEVIAPLYSQPAIELFLRIPIYTHFEDGRDRGLARRAFAADVPLQIRRRLWKDRAPGFFEKVIEHHQPLLREMLLDGVLASNGWLDRVAVEKAVDRGLARNGAVAAELFRHLDTEVWARHWQRC